MKILLNYDYTVPVEKDGSKPSLKKKMSRAVFEIKPVTEDQDDDEEDDDYKDDEAAERDDGSDYDDDEGEGNFSACCCFLAYSGEAVVGE